MPIFASFGRRSMSLLNAFTLATGIVGSGAVFLVAPRPAMACGPEPYIGTICSFAFPFCPRGYLPANGQQVAVNTNMALFALIGVTYGGNGTTTFMLPDLRSRSPIGVGPGVPPAGPALGAQLGQSTITLLSTNLPAHTHPATFTGTGGGTQSVSVPANAGTLGVAATLQGKQASGNPTITAGAFLGQGGSGSGAANIYVDPNAPGTPVNLGGLSANLTGTAGNGAFSFNVNSGITGGSVNVLPNTGGQPFSTQSPALALTMCIATAGIYPPRD